LIRQPTDIPTLLPNSVFMSTSVVHGSSTFYWEKLVGIVVEAGKGDHLAVLLGRVWAVCWQRTTMPRAGKPIAKIDNIISF
jgi:hypothetical protein